MRRMRMHGMTRKQSAAGFTILELLVVSAIITIVVAMVVVRDRTGSERSKLDVIADRFIVDVREMQSAATAIRVDDLSTNGAPIGGYGIQIQKHPTAQYTFFADRNGDHVLSSGEALQAQSLPDGFMIDSVDCRNASSEVLTCGTVPTGASANLINIVFQPPDPALLLRRQYQPTPSPTAPERVQKVTVNIRIPTVMSCSVAENCRKIIVTTGGEISNQAY